MVPVLRNKALKILHVPYRGALHVDIIRAIFNLFFAIEFFTWPQNFANPAEKSSYTVCLTLFFFRCFWHLCCSVNFLLRSRSMYSIKDLFNNSFMFFRARQIVSPDARGVRSSLAKGFAHGPLSLHPWQIELDFVITADRHLADFTSPTYKDDITFDQ